MSSLDHTTSTGRQSAHDILATLLKSIGTRVNAYCWHINGHDDFQESSLAQLLGISQLELTLILEECGCLAMETKEVDRKGLERLVNNVGKEYCEMIQYRITTKNKEKKQLYFLRIGLVHGENAFPVPKDMFKKGELVQLPTRSHSPRLQSNETDQITLLVKSRQKTEEEQNKDPHQKQKKGQQGAIGSETKSMSKAKSSMSELESEMIQNIATVFAAGEVNPPKFTQRMQRTIRRCIQNYITDAVQLVLSNLAPPETIDTVKKNNTLTAKENNARTTNADENNARIVEENNSRLVEENNTRTVEENNARTVDANNALGSLMPILI